MSNARTDIDDLGGPDHDLRVLDHEEMSNIVGGARASSGGVPRLSSGIRPQIGSTSGYRMQVSTCTNCNDEDCD